MIDDDDELARLFSLKNLRIDPVHGKPDGVVLFRRPLVFDAVLGGRGAGDRATWNERVTRLREDFDAMLEGRLDAQLAPLFERLALHCWAPDRYPFLSAEEVRAIALLSDEAGRSLDRLSSHSSLIRAWLTRGQAAELALRRRRH